MAFENFFATKLYTAIDATTTTITLETVPTVSPGHLVIESRNATNREIIKYTGITGNQVTGVTRGVGGTSAKTHEKNALVEMNVVAQDLQDALNAPDNLAQYASEIGGDFIVSGTGVVAQTTGLTASFSNITYYINGYRYTKSSIANKTYTASKDTYIFIDTNGNITYTEVANNATAPTTPTNSILVAVVVTSASAITSVGLKNRGAIKAQNVDLATLFYTGNAAMSRTGNGTLGSILCPFKSGSVVRITATASDEATDMSVAQSGAQILIGGTIVSMTRNNFTGSFMRDYRAVALVKTLTADNQSFQAIAQDIQNGTHNVGLSNIVVERIG